MKASVLKSSPGSVTMKRFAQIQSEMGKISDWGGWLEFEERNRKALRAVGREAEIAAGRLSVLIIAPHRGGFTEEIGWKCETCGAESFDLEILKEIPCE